jgi:hypothetical protein
MMFLKIQRGRALLLIAVSLLTGCAPPVLGADERIEILGIVESIEGRTIVVDGRTFIVPNDLDVDPLIEVGSPVEVKAHVQRNGDLVVLDIDIEEDALEEIQEEAQDAQEDQENVIEEIDVTGTVEELDEEENRIKVDGEIYVLPDDITVPPGIVAGSLVEMHVDEHPNGDLIVLEIELAEDEEEDEDDDDNSGRGNGDDDDNSGPGNGDD